MSLSLSVCYYWIFSSVVSLLLLYFISYLLPFGEIRLNIADNLRYSYSQNRHFNVKTADSLSENFQMIIAPLLFKVSSPNLSVRQILFDLWKYLAWNKASDKIQDGRQKLYLKQFFTISLEWIEILQVNFACRQILKWWNYLYCWKWLSGPSTWKICKSQ